MPKIDLRPLLLAFVVCALIACHAKVLQQPTADILATVNGVAINAPQIREAEALVLQNAVDDGAQVQRSEIDRMIEQELLAQQARSSKLDHDPSVMLAIEEAKRHALAGAWLSRVAAAVPIPEEAEIHDYYTNHAYLYSERSAYKFQYAVFWVDEDRLTKLKRDLERQRFDAAVNLLSSNNIQVSVHDTEKAGDQLDEDIARQLATLSNGQTALIRVNEEFLLLQLLQSRPAPVSESEARLEVVRAVMAQRVNQRIRELTASLRASAHIEVKSNLQILTAPSGTATQTEIQRGVINGLQ
jgi:EpsD family peptidyl-prolyl cis-trans isomerase